MDYSGKIQTRERGRCFRIYNFQWYLRNSMQNFQELIKNNVEYIQGRPRKIFVKFPGVLGFLTLKFPRDVTYIILPNGRVLFYLKFSRIQRKTKTIQSFFFQKKYVLNPPPPSPPPPCLDFSSGIAHSKTIDLNWSYEALV